MRSCHTVGAEVGEGVADGTLELDVFRSGQALKERQTVLVDDHVVILLCHCCQSLATLACG